MSNTQRPQRKKPVGLDPRALREARIRAGLLQKDLAEALNIAPSVISEVEAGKRGLKPATRLRLAQVLRCDPISFAPLEVAA